MHHIPVGEIFLYYRYVNYTAFLVNPVSSTISKQFQGRAVTAQIIWFLKVLPLWEGRATQWMAWQQFQIPVYSWERCMPTALSV